MNEGTEEEKRERKIIIPGSPSQNASIDLTEDEFLE